MTLLFTRSPSAERKELTAFRGFSRIVRAISEVNDGAGAYDNTFDWACSRICSIVIGSGPPATDPLLPRSIFDEPA